MSDTTIIHVATCDCFGYTITAAGDTLELVYDALLQEYRKQYSLREVVHPNLPDANATFEDLVEYFGVSRTELPTNTAIFE